MPAILRETRLRAVFTYVVIWEAFWLFCSDALIRDQDCAGDVAGVIFILASDVYDDVSVICGAPSVLDYPLTKGAV